MEETIRRTISWRVSEVSRMVAVFRSIISEYAVMTVGQPNATYHKTTENRPMGEMRKGYMFSSFPFSF